MNFEQWKLRRELEEQTEFNSYSSKVESTTTFCFIIFGVSVIILMALAITFYKF